MEIGESEVQLFIHCICLVARELLGYDTCMVEYASGFSMFPCSVVELIQERFGARVG